MHEFLVSETPLLTFYFGSAELLEPITVGVDSENVSVQFNTVADAMYQLEVSTDMTTWTADGAQIVGNGSALLLQRAAPESGQNFYRLRKL